MAMRNASDHIAPAGRFVMYLLGETRRWLFLPSLSTAALMLVLFRGGDTLSVCFNTIALLFMCEIDNLAYAILLSESMRARVELEGRMEIGDSQRTSLMRSKVAHVASLIVAVPSAVAFASSGTEEILSSAWMLPRAAFLVAGAVEAVWEAAAPVAESADKGLTTMCKTFAKVIGKSVLGFGGFYALVMLSLV